MRELPLVVFEKFVPSPPTVNMGEGKTFRMPSIRKLRLTEESELAIFGDLSKYRDGCLPPLFIEDKYYVRKWAYLSDEQAEIYNEKMNTKSKYPHPNFPEVSVSIQAGVVEVYRSGYNIELHNTNNSSYRSIDADG